MLTFIAQQLKIPGDSNSIIQGVLNSENAKFKFTNLASVIDNASPIFFSISGISLFSMLLWAGYDLMTSMGDPKKAESGKRKLTYSLLAFLLIFCAYWVLQFVDAFLGFGVYSGN